MQRDGGIDRCLMRVSVEQRSKVLDLESFKRALKHLDIAGDSRTPVNAAAVFDLAESRREGGITLRELGAALRSLAAGEMVPLPDDLRDAQAREQVRWEMAPFRRGAGDLRRTIRQGPPEDDIKNHRLPPQADPKKPATYLSDSMTHLLAETEAAKSRPSERYTMSPFSPVAMISNPALRKDVLAAADRVAQKTAPVDLDLEAAKREAAYLRSQEVLHAPCAKSHSNFRHFLNELPPDQTKPLQDSIHSYYQEAGKLADKDCRMLRGTLKVFPHHKKQAKLLGHIAQLDREDRIL
jgi:hypothetical protein